MTASMRYAAPSSGARWRDVTRGGLAVAAILVLVAGVPLALAFGVGWPLPHGVPSFSEVSDALRDNYIDDSVLVKALACICWLIWIELVASLMLEAIAAARGRRAAHMPLAGGMQKMAARLVAAALLLAVLAPGRGGVTKPVHGAVQLRPHGTAVTLVADGSGASWSGGWTNGGGGGASESAAADLLAASVGLPVYEVQRRDTLWDIAEKHLGDPFRWPEIYELNKDVPQPDGTMLTNPDLIYVGWQLRLPADAIGLPGSAPATTPAPAIPTPTPTAPASDETPAPTPNPDVMHVIDDSEVVAVGLETPADPASEKGSDTMVVLPEDDDVVEAQPAGGSDGVGATIRAPKQGSDR